MQRIRLSWLIGGTGFTACGVVGVVRCAVTSSEANIVLALLGDVLWGAAVIALAFGFPRGASVAARRPLALVASVLLALWPAVGAVVALVVGSADEEQERAGVAWDYALPVLLFMAGLVVSVQVARARVVPTPWNWAPLWVVGAQTVIWIMPQVIGAASPLALIDLAELVAALRMLGFLLATFGLGFIALHLSAQPRPESELASPSS